MPPLFLCGTNTGRRIEAVHEVADLSNINVYRTEPNASAASDTLDARIKSVGKIFELVHKPLANPSGFGIPRIVAGPMKRKERVHAAVPVSHPNAASTMVLVLNVEAPASWAYIGAGAAVDA